MHSGVINSMVPIVSVALSIKTTNFFPLCPRSKFPWVTLPTHSHRSFDRTSTFFCCCRVSHVLVHRLFRGFGSFLRGQCGSLGLCYTRNSTNIIPGHRIHQIQALTSQALQLHVLALVIRLFFLITPPPFFWLSVPFVSSESTICSLPHISCFSILHPSNLDLISNPLSSTTFLCYCSTSACGDLTIDTWVSWFRCWPCSQSHPFLPPPSPLSSPHPTPYNSDAPRLAHLHAYSVLHLTCAVSVSRSFKGQQMDFVICLCLEGDPVSDRAASLPIC